MLDLLRADFFRMRKSKLTLVMLIIVAVFPILTTLLYLGIDKLLFEDEFGSLLGEIFDAKSMIGSTFSLGNNIGLVIPIFAGLFVMMDLNNGTLRNKIIGGKSRIKIYFSHLITSATFDIVMIVLYSAITAALSLAFFDYGMTVDSEEAKNIIFYIISGLLSYVFIATVSTFYAMVFKSSAPTIIFTIITGLGLCLISDIVLIILPGLDDIVQHVVRFIPTLSVYAFYANRPGGITNIIFTEGTISLVFFSALNTFLGIVLFKKKDIK